MKYVLKCSFLLLVSSVNALPVSEPAYQSPQYISAQAVPAYTFKQPQAQGLQYNIQPQIQNVQTQYLKAQVPSVTPIYEPDREGLQNYGRQNPSALQQIQNTAQYTTPIFLNQIQSAKLASQAQQAFSSAQKTAPVSNYVVPRPVQPITTISQAPTQQIIQAQTQQYVREQPQQYVREQPQQYVREQPQQVRYIQRPAPQYRLPQPKQQIGEKEEQEKEDYDSNPSYQFGFDVKDDQYTNYQNRKEQREGNKITGSYSVVDADGYIRTVQYTADPKEGFKAEVTRQPTDIVVKIPKPQPQFQVGPRQRLQYSQDAQQQRGQAIQKQDVPYQYE